MCNTTVFSFSRKGIKSILGLAQLQLLDTRFLTTQTMVLVNKQKVALVQAAVTLWCLSVIFLKNPGDCLVVINHSFHQCGVQEHPWFQEFFLKYGLGWSLFVRCYYHYILVHNLSFIWSQKTSFWICIIKKRHRQTYLKIRFLKCVTKVTNTHR